MENTTESYLRATDENNIVHYKVGILAEGDHISEGYEEVYLDYLRLRAKVYVDQTGMLSEEAILEDGTERDEDDYRSIHFGVIADNCSCSRVVAALRIILKSDLNMSTLPVENYFPNLFSFCPISNGALELSRYICTREYETKQFELQWMLLCRVMHYINEKNILQAYAVIETSLERVFRTRGVPIKRLSEPQFVLKYRSYNIPVIFNIKLTARLMSLKYPRIFEKITESNDVFLHFKICGDNGVIYENN